MYYKLSDLVIKNIFVQSKLFALNFPSKHITHVTLLVRLEISIWYSSFDVNPIQDGHFWGCSRMGGKKVRLPNICHTYPSFDVNAIQDGHFQGYSRIGGKKVRLPIICHTYPTMMKHFTVIPYLKKI